MVINIFICVCLLAIVILLIYIYQKVEKAVLFLVDITYVVQRTEETNRLLDKLCKKIVRLNNNLFPNNPDAWLGLENQSRAAELRGKNPETFEMVSELLKMYLGYDDKKGG